MNVDVEALRAVWDESLRRCGPGAVFAELDRACRAAGLAYGGRPVCQVLRPLFLRRDVYERLLRDAELVAEALRIAAADPGIVADLHMTPFERELIALDGGLALADPLARLDAFLDPEGNAHFVEYNGESPGGIAFGEMLAEIFATLPPWQAVGVHHPLEAVPMTSAIVANLVESYRLWAARVGRSPAERPSVAIIDFEEVPTRGEFEIFRRAFELAGLPCAIADPGRLELVGDRLVLAGRPVDLVYRRLITQDILGAPERAATLIEAVRSRAACVVNGFGGHLLSHKALFAVLSDPETRPKLDGEQRAAVERTIPWTRVVAPEVRTTPPGGGAPSALRSTGRRLRERLVLKPASGYGGKGVLLGWETPEADWREAWKRAEQDAGAWVVQERVSVPALPFPVATPEGLVDLDMRFDLGPYLLGSRGARGSGVRLSSGDMLNVAAGKGSAVPLVIVG